MEVESVYTVFRNDPELTEGQDSSEMVLFTFVLLINIKL
jgi:hypothetical protein